MQIDSTELLQRRLSTKRKARATENRYCGRGFLGGVQHERGCQRPSQRRDPGFYISHQQHEHRAFL